MIEFCLFVFGLLFFLRQISRMHIFLFFFPHLVRGITGFLLYKKLPRSHEVVGHLGIDQDLEDQLEQGEEKVSFDQLHQRVKRNMEVLFFKYMKDL
mmetsp:Transcript_16902/g.26005  ORF Transcript_16902/g.26005 Transcript_16902/m.26005 type:complete len:96 (-) Transcript_16902:345-632(-)